MTNENRKFKIIISVILALVLLWAVAVSIVLAWRCKNETLRREKEIFGLYVCGVPVRFENASDVLGDGTVMYDPGSNILMLSNATLEYDGAAAIFSEIDLTISLDGENKIICNSAGTSAGIYASNLMLRKDVSIIGAGTLTVEGNGGGLGSLGAIVADDLWLYSDVSVVLTDVAEDSCGIECGNLVLMGENLVTVQLDALAESVGVFASGNVSLMENTTLDVSNLCAGEKIMGIECTGSFMACEGSTVNATSGDEDAGVLCHSVFFDYGATLNAEIDAIDGVRCEN